PNISTGIANHKSLRWGLFCYTNSKRGGSHGLFVIFFSDCCSKRYVPFFTFQRKRVKEGLDRLKTSAFLCRLPGDRRLKAKCSGRLGEWLILVRLWFYWRIFSKSSGSTLRVGSL